MTLVLYKCIAAALIFLVSIGIAIYPLRKKSTPTHSEGAELGEALASGIFLGAAFFHMLPESIKAFGPVIYPIPEAICVGGFLLMLLLERFSLAYTYSRHSIPFILVMILIIHALIEGTALGIGANFSEAFMLFIAIIAHKGSETFALCTTLVKHQLAYRPIVFIIILFSLMTPIGIAFGTSLDVLLLGNKGLYLAAFFNAFAAGTFLYISTLHHVHFHQHAGEKQGMMEFACLVVGVVTMGVIALWT